MHENGRIQSHNIGAIRHGLPPRVLDVSEQLDAQWAEVPAAIQATINFRTLENKALPFGERENRIEG